MHELDDRDNDQCAHKNTGRQRTGVRGHPLDGLLRAVAVASIALSSVQGSPAAISRTQRSSVHEYQRPDDALVVDTTRSTLDGSSMSLTASKVAMVMARIVFSDRNRQSAYERRCH